MSVRVKVCGVTRVADAELAISFGVDLIGLNFYPPSPRSLTIDCAREIRRTVGARCEVVGVFVNAPRQHIREHLDELRLDFLQFHGDENEDALKHWPVRVIRVLRLTDGTASALNMPLGADYLLLDTFDPELFGGTGRARSFDGLENIDLSRVFISGGLSPGNVAAAASLNPYAVDVASGVESAPGVKDPAKLRSFIVNAKSPR
jgi:phosphoribosylanthranilate isomerase